MQTLLDDPAEAVFDPASAPPPADLKRARGRPKVNPAADPEPPPVLTPEQEFGLDRKWAQKWAKWPAVELPVEKILVEDRYRTDPGDLDSLARSIARFGLLQPITVTLEGDGVYRLNAGGRRLAAVRDKLKLPTVRAVVVDVRTAAGQDRLEQLIRMEIEENVQREQPSPRDQEAAWARIETLMRKQGPTPPGGVPLRERVAQAVGISHETHRLQRAVFAAADEDPEQFGEIAEKLNRREIGPEAAFKQLAAARAKDGVDGAGLPLPAKLVKVFATAGDFDLLAKHLAAARKLVGEVSDTPGGERLAALAGEPDALVVQKGEKYDVPALRDLEKNVREARPFAQCPVCFEAAGEPGKYRKTCPACRGSGAVGKAAWERLVETGDPGVKKMVEYYARKTEKGS